MGWQAPRTWTTGELVTAAMLNQDIRDNENALKEYLDASQATPARTSGTIYQNTGGKIRIVTAFAYANASGEGGLLQAEVKSSSPPDTIVAIDELDYDVGIKRGCITFIVPVNYYYRITAPTGTVLTVAEWDFL